MSAVTLKATLPALVPPASDFGLNYPQSSSGDDTRWSGLYCPMPPFISKAAKRRGSRMVDEKDENAQLMAQLRFTSGQVNMLMLNS